MSGSTYTWDYPPNSTIFECYKNSLDIKYEVSGCYGLNHSFQVLYQTYDPSKNRKILSNTQFIVSWWCTKNMKFFCNYSLSMIQMNSKVLSWLFVVLRGRGLSLPLAFRLFFPILLCIIYGMLFIK